jgi:hypothetical protein
MRAVRSILFARFVRTGLAAAAVVATFLTVVVPPAGASSKRVVITRPRPYALGVYVGAGNPAGAGQFSKQVAATVPYASEFLSGASWATIADPSWQLQQWAGTGYQIIWSVPMLPNSGASLATGATGAYNAHFAALAQALVAGGQANAILRVGWEFNGFWYPWDAAGHPAQFVAYWRNIVTAMRSVPGAHFRFVWNPNPGVQGNTGSLSAYYPGSAYVDYVALDIYDILVLHYPGAQAAFEQFLTEPYGMNWLASFAKAHHVPMVFPEWGLGWGTCRNGAPVNVSSGGTCGGDNPVFVRDSSKWFATHNVYEVTYWDYGTSKVGGTMNPRARQALRNTWAPPTFKVAVTVHRH